MHSMEFQEDRLKNMPAVNEMNLFSLNIPEGCVMNRIISPQNLKYKEDGSPEYKIGCCVLKKEVG